MIKKILFSIAFIATTLTFGQVNTITISTSAGAGLTELVVSENGFFLDRTAPDTYAQVDVIITSTVVFTGLTEPVTYDDIYFPLKTKEDDITNPNKHVFRPAIGNLTDELKSSSVLVDEVRTRTWVIDQLELNPVASAVPPVVGETIEYLTSGGGVGTIQVPRTPIVIVPSYTIPSDEKHVYEFNNDGDFEDFTNNTDCTTSVSGGFLTISNTTADVSSYVIKNSLTTYVDADTYKYAHVFYRNTSKNTQFRLEFTSPTGASGNQNAIIAEMGISDALEVVKINLGAKTEWAGNVTTLKLIPRVNNTTSFAGDFFIDRIEFSATTTLSSSSPSFKNITVYPNPTTGIINISDISNINGDIMVSNVLGQVVKTIEASTTIDISDLPQGIYFLQTENSLIKKIIKK
ncbi:T9SS type A sorting domain-containing protein [Wenyingzhuangia sp. 2_MG-2023]|uniref:T9SS type A sorting domain-containing protein n=1 Tax=Wenyingzhuangia sp. 2_MG-2023 TaxID=3062639 RepID=UPI0026E20873|nr:T9SS type A sorting domain-containing protein [Wenyingzhuangia sp. 2_MG-2023]MDO6738943.1 T9SS type A sorting domain-containing protein [Wenyingzhuangia sp. 2_MG-2023]MDO6803695.1 T9SS type A sorting domain-containing protein [Wenyingzhuangia sp. 1_MG-2023]